MSVAKPVTKFRDTFFRKDLKKKVINWFPGHMHKGMTQMQRKLAIVDCIIEVHDARIPFSGRNPDFYKKLTAIKPHIFVLNKMDLIDMSLKEKIEAKLKKENIENVIFTNSKDHINGSNVSKVLPLAIELMKNVEAFEKAFQPEYNMLIIGIPNVGKSSLINRLRNLHMQKRSSNQVGAIPGITKSVLERVLISTSPSVYLFDTPGVMQPSVDNLEVGMRLACCCTLKDTVVGEELIADYMLFWLNKRKNFSYVQHFGLSSPLDDIRMVLLQIACAQKLTRIVNHPARGIINMPDFEAAARLFIKAFRTGLFGKFILDDDLLLNT